MNYEVSVPEFEGENELVLRTSSKDIAAKLVLEFDSNVEVYPEERFRTITRYIEQYREEDYIIEANVYMHDYNLSERIRNILLSHVAELFIREEGRNECSWNSNIASLPFQQVDPVPLDSLEGLIAEMVGA